MPTPERGEPPRTPKGTARTSPLEWGVAAFSLVLVLSVAGFLLRDAFRSPPSPPRITIEVDSVVRAGTGYLVEFRALNAGRTTAAGLEVEGEILADTGSVETTQVTIDYVPAKGKTAAGLFFANDPRRHRLEIRPKGYDRP
ncbi:MAG TPA: hypothetical protein VM890_05775 [Longimicrobium sp.]|jgi:uncharacterized protein (TIGR02588 family)|nr:hypothetical protein [Longimicrobium sp.]